MSNQAEHSAADINSQDTQAAMQEKLMRDELIQEEARSLAYLDALRLDEIEDEAIRTAVGMMLGAKGVSNKEKCRNIQSLVMASRIKGLCAKIDTLDDCEKENLSQYSLDNLQKLLAKGDKLDKDDMVKAEDAIKVMSECMEKIGDRKIAFGLAHKADYTRMSQDKKMAYFAANIAREMQKKRNEILNKTKERLGVA